MKVAAQLLKEFWFPLAVAIAWTAYNIIGQPSDDWSKLRAFVNLFGPTFFFASWLVAQWYRVRKQQRLEDGLTSIEDNVKRMLSELETRTNDVLGDITGGDSVCYLVGSPASNNGLAHTALLHIGKHPLYEVRARIVDLEVFDHFKGQLTFENIRKSEIHRDFGNLIPGHAAMVEDLLALGPSAVRRFNIFSLQGTVPLRNSYASGEWTGLGTLRLKCSEMKSWPLKKSRERIRGIVLVKSTGMRPNPALNADAHRRAFSPPAVAG